MLIISTSFEFVNSLGCSVAQLCSHGIFGDIPRLWLTVMDPIQEDCISVLCTTSITQRNFPLLPVQVTDFGPDLSSTKQTVRQCRCEYGCKVDRVPPRRIQLISTFSRYTARTGQNGHLGSHKGVFRFLYISLQPASCIL